MPILDLVTKGRAIASDTSGAWAGDFSVVLPSPTCCRMNISVSYWYCLLGTILPMFTTLERRTAPPMHVHIVRVTFLAVIFANQQREGLWPR